ncbi:hypothetical protein [Olivibacter oleidegradans]|uniref:GLPGLI family protein n=1 Tax=Olivibacter oleidegradans TaxID=760123 RepID=A0ABV6HDI3_9SPHI
MIRTLLFSIFAALICQTHIAKANDRINELDSIFRLHADSTIIFTGSIPFGTAPENILIISKKGDTISLFSYRYAMREIPSYEGVPRSLADYISRTKYSRRGSVVGPFFEVHPISEKKGKKLWSALMQHHPWQLKDNAMLGTGCPVKPKVTKDKDGNTIEEYRGRNMESHSYNVRLITKTDSKKLSYFAPEDLQKECPPEEDRQHIISIKRLLLQSFGKKSVFE